ncbi:YbaB/EbfC family nucleoid-associated protein [Nonomuraea sp. NPDC050536]|uniref:YbaB/EbfC family nucleoid-associated protein n=1 Tax=Nonomuraea sp. NPDC050536 TaxID=3364366 RepID=UPI0037C8857D
MPEGSPMSYFQPDDLSPENLERMVRDSEESLRRLAGMTDELASVTGKGESRSGLVGAVVDNGGRLDQIELEPRAMRMSSAELSEEIVEAVRAAQDSVQRQSEELLAQAMGSAEAGLPDMDKLQRQTKDIQDSFALSVENSLAEIDRLTRRNDW